MRAILATILLFISIIAAACGSSIDEEVSTSSLEDPARTSASPTSPTAPTSSSSPKSSTTSTAPAVEPTSTAAAPDRSGGQEEAPVRISITGENDVHSAETDILDGQVDLGGWLVDPPSEPPTHWVHLVGPGPGTPDGSRFLMLTTLDDAQSGKDDDGGIDAIWIVHDMVAIPKQTEHSAMLSGADACVDQGGSHDAELLALVETEPFTATVVEAWRANRSTKTIEVMEPDGLSCIWESAQPVRPARHTKPDRHRR